MVWQPCSPRRAWAGSSRARLPVGAARAGHLETSRGVKERFWARASSPVGPAVRRVSIHDESLPDPNGSKVSVGLGVAVGVGVCSGGVSVGVAVGVAVG